MNNGKRIDRFNAKKVRKEILKTTNIQLLAQNGLLFFDYEGEIKVVPASHPGWLLLEETDGGDNGDGDNGGGGPNPVPVFNEWTFYEFGDYPLTVYGQGILALNLALYTSLVNNELSSPLSNNTYLHYPNDPNEPWVVDIVDGIVVGYKIKPPKN